jgi:hypothetical protein
MYVEAASHPARGGHLRMDLLVSNRGGQVGTDIDCAATISGDNSYNLDLTVRRSSMYSADEQATETTHDASAVSMTRNFSTDFSVEMHDGQTADGPSATDPFNGHILKISVTLHVVK